jgi:hypothetical protein
MKGGYDPNLDFTINWGATAIHNNLHKSLKIEEECAKFRFEFR